jgi:hypothetical protein
LAAAGAVSFSAVLQRPQKRAAGPLTCPHAAHSIPRGVPHPSQNSLVLLFWQPQRKHCINGPSDVSRMDCIQESLYLDKAINYTLLCSNKNGFLRISDAPAFRTSDDRSDLVKCSVQDRIREISLSVAFQGNASFSRVASWASRRLVVLHAQRADARTLEASVIRLKTRIREARFQSDGPGCGGRARPSRGACRAIGGRQPPP